MSEERRGRRVHQRFDCDLPITLRLEDSGSQQEAPVLEARASNISLGGLFVHTAQSIPYGAQGAVLLHLPKLLETVEIAVTVRWVTPEGVGLQFGSLRAREVWGLNELFDSL